jgi:hypothetical protein
MEPQAGLSDLLRAGTEPADQTKPRKRLKRDKPDALAVPDAPNMTSLARMQACAAGQRVDGLHG